MPNGARKPSLPHCARMSSQHLGRTRCHGLRFLRLLRRDPTRPDIEVWQRRHSRQPLMRRSAYAEPVIRARGARMLLLPRYSSDYNRSSCRSPNSRRTYAPPPHASSMHSTPRLTASATCSHSRSVKTTSKPQIMRPNKCPTLKRHPVWRADRRQGVQRQLDHQIAERARVEGHYLANAAPQGVAADRSQTTMRSDETDISFTAIIFLILPSATRETSQQTLVDGHDSRTSY